MIGTLIKDARLKKSLSQKELAKLLGVRYEAVNSWENNRNKPNLKAKRRIAEVLGIKWD